MTTPTKTPGFTPGPWRAQQVKSDSGGPFFWRIDGHILMDGATAFMICKLPDYSRDNDANARLIAQAPALYEALRGMIEFLDTYVDEIRDCRGNLLWTDFDGIDSEARAVLAAVEGGGQ